jgi:hypothetical protein
MENRRKAKLSADFPLLSTNKRFLYIFNL